MPQASRRVRRSRSPRVAPAPSKALHKLDEGKGNVSCFFVGTKPGARAVALLPGLVQAALDALPIPRRMHWGSGTALFVRPVHWGGDVVRQGGGPRHALRHPRGPISRVGIVFHAPRPIRIASPGSYERTLARARGTCLADFAARGEHIRAPGRGRRRPTCRGVRLIAEALLQEVTALVEWPVVLTGRFEERFLSLPREVLTSTLEDHQRYLPGGGCAGPAVAGLHRRSATSRAATLPRCGAGNEARGTGRALADAAFFSGSRTASKPLAARPCGARCSDLPGESSARSATRRAA